MTFSYDDPEKPIEEYAGILGYFLDGHLTVIDNAIKSLETIDFIKYRDQIFDDPDKQIHEIILPLKKGKLSVVFDWSDDLLTLIGQIPSIDLINDPEISNTGPGYSSGISLFIADDSTLDDVCSDVSSLVNYILQECHDSRRT